MAHAAHRPPPNNRRRLAIGLILAVAVAVLVLWLERPVDRTTEASPSSTGTGSASPTNASSHSPKPKPSSSASASPAIADGRSFVYVKKLNGDPPNATVTFDLAYFLTGDAANQAAADHGLETPVPNDYYIVNDNPMLRTMPISPTVEIDAIDWTNCCDTSSVSYADWAASIANPTAALHGAESGWWITVVDGEIVKIEEQYTP